MSRRLLSVHAHPDDEVSRGGATVAHYTARGAEAVLVTCTDGAAGEVLNPDVRLPPDLGMAEVRRRELDRSAGVLGYERVHRLGFADSGPAGDAGGGRAFVGVPVAEAGAALARVIAREDPDVIIGYGPRHVRDPHPDHLRAHAVLCAALDELGPGPAVFWVAFSRERHRALSRRCAERGVPDPYAGGLRFRDDAFDDDVITTRVPLDLEDFARRSAALRCHVSQVAERSAWFTLDDPDQHSAYPFDEYVQVHPPALRPDDLFR